MLRKSVLKLIAKSMFNSLNIFFIEVFLSHRSAAKTVCSNSGKTITQFMKWPLNIAKFEKEVYYRLKI